MDSVEVPLELLVKIVTLADGFGEPLFAAIVGEEDGTVNGVEAGRVAVFDAEFSWVADYRSAEVANAERLRDLLNAVTDELGDFVRPERRFTRKRRGA